MERSEIETLVHSYLDAVSAQDADAATALFADDGVQVDPMGTAPNVGKDAISKFFTDSFANKFSVERDPKIVIGNDHANFRFVITVPLGEDSIVVNVSDTIRVSEDGKIAELWAIQDMG